MQAESITGPRVYMDANATSPLRPKVRSAMEWALGEVGNPSSLHHEGRRARAIVEGARRSIAEALGLSSGAVLFTSGGSEANGLALQPGDFSDGGGACTDLLISSIEHPSVLCGGGFSSDRIHSVGVEVSGLIDCEALERRLDEVRQSGGRSLVSVMAANNEVGTIQPLKEVSACCARAGALLHVDAAQVLGRLSVRSVASVADLMTISAHKGGGPQGIGALVMTKAGLRPPRALFGGGGQERFLRPGTENVAAISGFGALFAQIAQAFDEETARLKSHRARLERGLLALCPDAVIPGYEAPRLVNTIALWSPRFDVQTLLIRLDLAGLSVGAGSACSSGKLGPSHVLRAMKYAPAMALRFSLSFDTRDEEIERAIAIMGSVTGDP